MPLFLVAIFLLLLALLPVAMFLANQRQFLPATQSEPFLKLADEATVSVLIPARNEEKSIGPAIDGILQSMGPKIELIVLDDQSEDQTSSIVRQRIAIDPRLRLLEGIELPSGWNGKQHACWILSQAASSDWLLFVDADVRLSSDAIRRMVAESLKRNAPLVSGFPYQETLSFSERLLIPLMHFVLLSYLPIQRMRSSPQPGLAAGCGQLMLARRDVYFDVDGHRAIQSSRHDGLKLPRAFREKGFLTDIFDASDIATCRMYHNRREVVQGLLKNATEGIANPKLIGIFSVLMSGSAFLPILFLVVALILKASMITITLLAIATFLSFVPRWLAANQFKQSRLGVCLHPVSVAWFLLLQWQALLQAILGRRVTWRGRN
jgi:glycosyltransferase involved in cell wall biosynthesis